MISIAINNMNIFSLFFFYKKSIYSIKFIFIYFLVHLHLEHFILVPP